jgi:hypothetical protein
MAQVSDGTVPLKFGTTGISGWEIVSVSETESGNDIEIPDEIGDIVTHISNIGKRTEVSIELIANTGTALPVVGAVFTYTNAAAASKAMRILTVGNVQTQGDVMRTTITGKVFAGITPS